MTDADKIRKFLDMFDSCAISTLETTSISICRKFLDACVIIETEPPGCDSSYLARKALEECAKEISD